MLVADDLHLDVARPREIPLDVHLVPTEERLGLALCAGHRLLDLTRGVDDLHAAATTPEGCLDRHRPPVLVTEGADLVGTGGELDGSGNDRRAAALGRPPARHLVAHLLDRRWWRSDEDHAEVRDRASEVGVLREEPVAGMDAIRAAAPDDVEDRRGVEIALRRRLATEGVRLVGEADMQCVAIELGVHGDRADAELTSGAHDPHRDLAAIGDEDLLEHAANVGSGRCPGSTVRWAGRDVSRPRRR